MATPKLTPNRLHELLDYNPETGVFVWLIALGKKIRVGAVAGSKNNGYIRIQIDGRAYLAHRLAWFYITGKWPKNQIDHCDTNKSNNSFKNLREADRNLNAQNQRRAHSRNSLNVLGVSFCQGAYQASIGVAGKLLYLGRYPTQEQAHAAYLRAKRRYHAGCTI